MNAAHADRLPRDLRAGECRHARAGRRPSRNAAPAKAWSAIALFFVATIALIALGALPTLADPARPPASTHGVVVGAADTLWSIATDNPVSGVSTLEMIAAIRGANELGPDDRLQPGAVVRVPAVDARAAALALK
jgi:hypothetical protein